MEHLSYELLSEWMKYVLWNDIVISSTRNFLKMKHLTQIIINKNNNNDNSNKCLYKCIKINSFDIENCERENNYSQLNRLRTRKIIIDFFNIIDLAKFTQNYHQKCYSLKVHGCYASRNVLFGPHLKTLTIEFYYNQNKKKQIKLDLILPESLKHLIIPNLCMDLYPQNLIYLECLVFMPDQYDTLPKLKKLVVGKYDMHIEDIIPTSVKTIVTRSENRYFTYHISENNKPKLKHLLVCNYDLNNNFFIDLKNKFPDLQNLSIHCDFLEDIINTFPNNLKKLKFSINGFFICHISITSLPNSLTHLSYINFQSFSSDFVLPTNLLYFKCIMKSVYINKRMQLPESLKMLIIRNCDVNLPRNLVYLNMYNVGITNGSRSSYASCNLKQLPKLKYLVLLGNTNKTELPRSLKYFEGGITFFKPGSYETQSLINKNITFVTKN